MCARALGEEQVKKIGMRSGLGARAVGMPTSCNVLQVPFTFTGALFVSSKSWNSKKVLPGVIGSFCASEKQNSKLVRRSPRRLSWNSVRPSSHTSDRHSFRFCSVSFGRYSDVFLIVRSTRFPSNVPSASARRESCGQKGSGPAPTCLQAT